jgi:hypothetical protein
VAYATVLLLAGPPHAALDFLTRFEGRTGWSIGHLASLARAYAEIDQALRSGAEAGDLRHPDFESIVRDAVGPAAQLAALGVTPEEAMRWLQLTAISPAEVRRWLAAGLDAAAATLWRNGGFEPERAAEWLRGGFDRAQAGAWRALEPAEAREWRDADFEPGPAKTWRDVGFAPADARAWGRGTPRVAAAWREAGFGASDSAPWRGLNASPGSARLWREAGFEPAEVELLFVASMTVHEASRWRAAGFTIDDIVSALDTGLGFRAACRRRLGLSSEATHRPPQCVLLFWGIDLYVRPGDDDLDWEERVLRRAAGADLSALRCAVDWYGTLPAPHAYVAIAESEIVAPGLRATPIAPPAPGADWERRLRRICELIGASWSTPRWYVAARLDH